MANPFRNFVDSISETNRSVEQWMQGYSAEQEEWRTEEDAWTPAADLLPNDDGDLVMLVDLPGVEREDVDLTLTDGELTISGSRRGRANEDEHYTRERYLGAFRRRLRLPDNVGKEDIRCDLRNGVLEVTVQGYARRAEPEQLQISGPDPRRVSAEQ